MDKVKQANWRNVVIGICLVLIGFIVGVVGTMNIANKKLEKNNIRLEIDLFEIQK